MAAVKKIDSNVVGLRYAEETSLGVLPGTPDWYPVEPNSFNDFGPEVVKLARDPINDSRQRQKGNTVDLNVSGGFEMDMTASNVQRLLQGFCFANFRTKAERTPTQATSGTNVYAIANTTGIIVGNLVYVTGFVNAANNGLKRVTTVTASTSITVAESLVTETPPATAKVVVVGHQAGSGDVTITQSGGALPVLGATALNFTTLGLIPGEFIFIGGDATAEKFATAADNGWARIKSITATAITLDKTHGTIVTDNGASKTIRLFFGRVLKNETGTSIVRKTVQWERTLGAPDDAQPSQIQSEYLVGSVANEFSMRMEQASKVTTTLSYIATNHETRTGVTGVKSGNRPALVSEDMFNTSSDVSRLRMNIVDPITSNPTSLFAFLSDFTVNINNNATPAKAVGVLGAFDVNAGQFVVGGEATVYFSDVTALAAIRNNSDVTMDMALVNGSTGAKKGIVVDIPLMALGNGRLDITKDEPIRVPLGMEAGADRTFNHTVLFTFFDFLPDAADV